MDAMHAAAAAASHSEAHSNTASIISHLAVENLMPSLRLAHHYVLTVAAQRYPAWLLRVHSYRDEAYLLLAAVLEAHSLGRNSASFAELFYGLRRASAPDQHQKLPSNVAQLLCLVLPAYLRAKLDESLDGWPLDDEEAFAAAGDGDIGGASAGADDPDINARSNAARGWSSDDNHLRRLLGRLPPSVRSSLRLLYRGICTLADGASLLQLLLFVNGRSAHATLAQRLLGFTLRRRTAADYARTAGPAAATTPLSSGAAASAAAGPTSMTSGAVAAGGGGGVVAVGGASTAPSLLAALKRLATLAEAPLRHARQLLLLSVFSFRLLEWWHSPQHAPPPPPRLIPPPPPSPPPRGAEQQLGRPHPATPATPLGFFHPPGVCGACRMIPREPTAAPSGYVYCGACARAALKRDGRCPVSGLPMRAEELVRIFETSRPPPQA